MRQLKQEVRSRAGLLGLDGEEFLQSIRAEIGELDFSVQHMEVVGSGTVYNNWNTGIPMNKLSNDGRQWEMELQLQDGEIKFRSDIEWILDWGRGEDDKDILVFKGGDIHVSEGFYRINIDIAAGTYQFTPISDPQ